VRQGGIFSPILFCICLDGLFLRLKHANLRCYIGRVYTGALGYADDITLLAPSAFALHKMLDICSNYATEYSISFNASKSKCIICRLMTYND
jgi:hypothetical protein